MTVGQILQPKVILNLQSFWANNQASALDTGEYYIYN